MFRQIEFEPRTRPVPRYHRSHRVRAPGTPWEPGGPTEPWTEGPVASSFNYIRLPEVYYSMPHRWISERRTIKVLLEPEGAIVAITMKTYSYLFVLSRSFVGLKKIRTQDRIVARAGYRTPRVLSLIAEVYPRGP